MRRLVFIDDDKSELEAFGEIVSGVYDYATVHWPGGIIEVAHGSETSHLCE
jgi:hypothetical protein